MKPSLEKLICTLGEQELMALHEIITGRIKALQRERILLHAQQFKIGDLVSFEGQVEKRSGVFMKINSKYISILTPQNIRWNVSPTFLKHEAKPSKPLQKLRSQIFNNVVLEV
jgi:hypothetical protein